ncbi:MAG: Rne/Rng family ribonuclease, partial [Terracidiphilus sp.]
MAKEICISSTPHETRLAILEDDLLAEIYYERENEYTLAGSIYNGRVTRVLPGMQSAFVDVGLERDAFLYVTDFMELEDQEETDELEKAAVSGANQAPREVRHSNGQDRGTQERAGQDRGGQDRGQRAGRSDQRSEQESRPTIEITSESNDAEFAPQGETAEAHDAAQESDETGTKRWRGRRRRRGGRGGSNVSSTPAESQEFIETHVNEAAEPEREGGQEIQASAASSRNARSEWSERRPERPERAPEPFVLPGESLRKYGGSATDSAEKPAAETSEPVRPSSSYKPASLIESPIVWDGSGLLPGESLSRHRNRQPEAPAKEEQTAAGFAPEIDNGSADAIEEQEFVDEVTAANPEQGVVAEAAQSPEHAEPVAFEDEMEEESFEPLSSESEPQAVAGEPVEELSRHESTGTENESTEFEGDRSASHNVDPLPPAEFRLFGLGGKKKKSEDVQPVPAPEETKPTFAPVVSSFSPGSGLVEEELIEGEEYDTPHHHHKTDEHDLEDYEEEEKLHTQIRSGELGEMLQEAHLDHRIQMKFEDKNGEEGEETLEGDEEDEEEEATASGTQPAGDGQGQPRRDRGGRGRRGRGDRGDRSGHRPGDRGRQSRRSAQTSDLPIISDLLKPGQEILVQIAKEPIAKKGARITSHIALPGRFLVFMPTVTHVGVSRKIASDEERQRLKRILTHERGDASGGFIVRTAAEGASEEELRADLRFLIHLWNEIKQRSDSSKSPALIYHDLSLIERILRDQVSSNFSSIWVDSEADYERIVRFLNRFSPSLVRRVKLYTKDTPLFEHFGIQDEISKALRSKVWLKSGGSIVINQTEALVAIDINTGKYVGKTARLEDTILKTNLDAIPEIVRQIRLRDLGGIIVIDFIDMDERKNRFKVMAALEEALKNDRAPTKVLQFNDFGLVAITRKRVKQSLERTLSVPCPTCQATGMVKSPATVCNEIYTELRKMKRHFEGSDVMLRVNPETVKVLKSNNGSWINEFEELVGKNILIKSDPT